MPRYARTIPRFSQGGLPPYLGGRALDQVERESMAQEREARIANYEQMHADIALAKERREEAEHQALAQQRLRYEQMMATAIKKIGHINPADPKAEEKWNQVFQEHPELFHNEKGLPSLTPYYEQYQRLAASAQANREKQQAAVEAQKARQDEINQRHQESMDLRRELKETQTASDDRRTKERNEDKRDTRLEVARGKYETLTEKAADARQEMKDTQTEIDRIKAKGTLSDEDKYHLDRMAVSLNKWKEKMNESQVQAKGIEKQFPELSPNYVPPEEKKTGTPTDATPTDTPSDAAETAQPDVPATRQTAPVSGGTLTPSGDMAPLGGTAPAATPTTTATPPGDWDALTEQMHSARGNADAARARRDDAMDVLTKSGFADFANPFSNKISEAQKAFDAANAEIDKHDAAYKDLFDKRGKLVSAPPTPAPAVTPVPPAPTATAVPAPALSDQTAQDLFNTQGATAVTPPVHPLEGKRVRHKETGQGGTIVNGAFVPDEQEALQDQDAA